MAPLRNIILPLKVCPTKLSHSWVHSQTESFIETNVYITASLEGEDVALPLLYIYLAMKVIIAPVEARESAWA